MTPLDARQRVIEFIDDLSGGSSEAIISKHRVQLNELADKLPVKFKTRKQIDEYLGYVIDEMVNLNAYFKSRKQGSIPFSKILSFANSDERLAAFLLRKGAERRKKEMGLGNLTIAGYHGVESSERLENFILTHKKNEYGFVHSEGGALFFFSLEANEILVELPGGKILAYTDYKEQWKIKGKMPVRMLFIYRGIRAREDQTEVMKACCIFIRQALTVLRNKSYERERKNRASKE